MLRFLLHIYAHTPQAPWAFPHLEGGRRSTGLRKAPANGTDPIVRKHISIRDRLRNHTPPSMRVRAAGQTGRGRADSRMKKLTAWTGYMPVSEGNPFQPRSARNSIPVRRLCAIIRPVVGRAGLQTKDCSLMEQIPRQQAVSPITHDTEENRYALRKRHSPLDRRHDKPEIRYCNAPLALQSQRKER